MTYNGNQLVKAEDVIGLINLEVSADFKNYSNVAIEYTYNKNGAMTKDLNKGISQIQYNSLNLPTLMDIKNRDGEGRNEYTYSASGVKLQVKRRWNPAHSTSPVIGSAVNVNALTETKTTDYAGNKIYEDDKLKILVDGGYIENDKYHFYIKDHLGNNRIVIDQYNNQIQSTQYYPFGMSFAESTGQSAQPYKYNDKELDGMHGLNWYDSDARFYDLAIPRTPTPDPHAESYYAWSPYAWVANNPMRIIDPTGMDWVSRIVDGVKEYYCDRDVRSQDDVISKYGEKGGVTHIASGTSFTKYNKDGSVKSQYTFFNDGSEENSYGAVVDANGNLMADDKIIYGNDFTIFGTSDNSVNAETLHKNLFGTSYIGPDNPKTYGNKGLGIDPADSYQYLPRNLSEYPAIQHDMRYDTKKATGLRDALLNKKVIGADIKLTIGSAGIMMHPSVPMKDKGRATAVTLAFGNISIAKFLMAIW